MSHATPGTATRASLKEMHQTTIDQMYGGDAAAYENSLQYDAEDTCLAVKTQISSIDARCSAYRNSRRVASTWISALEGDKSTLDALMATYSAAIEKCITFDVAFKEGKYVDKYRDKLRMTRESNLALSTTLAETLAFCESALAEYNAAQQPGRRNSGDDADDDDDRDENGAENRRSKVKAQIKCDKLTINSTPAQLNKWVDIFRCYCEYSNLLAASKFYQQQIAYSYMDEPLTAYLQGKVDATTPLFGDDPLGLEAPAGTARPGSVIHHLYEKFKAAYPLSSRRSTLLKMSQQPGQAWTVFYTKWDAAYRNADLERHVVGEVIQVELLIANTLDKELVDRFQKLNNPTREDLVATAVKYEADLKAQKTMKVGGGDSGPYAQHTESGGKQQKYQGGNTDNYIRNHFRKLEAEGKCVRCAQLIGSMTLEEHKEVCKAQGQTCKFCVSNNMGYRAKNHLEEACAKKLHSARAQKLDAGESEEDSSSEEEFDPHANQVTVEDCTDDEGADDEDKEDDDWLGLPGYYSYSSDSDHSDSDENEDWEDAPCQDAPCQDAPLPNVAEDSMSITTPSRSARQLNLLSPDIAHAMHGLRPLLKAKNHFEWTAYHDKEFNEVRSLVTEMSVKPFDMALPTRIYVDASRLYDMGYALCNVKTDTVTDVDYKSLLDSAHTGKARCLHKARTEFFWPRMTEDITEAVDNFKACQKFSRSQPEEEILSFPPTTEPMQLVGSDLFWFAGHQHVVMADAFSGMIFVKRLTRETSTAVINALMSFFRLIGLPQNLMSDNGPCNDSDEFKEFCHRYSIKHLTIPSFAIGDRVRLQDIRSQLWDKVGTVTGIRPVGRSFEVAVDGGGCLIRNRRFMKKLTEVKSDTATDAAPQSASRSNTERSGSKRGVASHVDAPPHSHREEDSPRDGAQRGIPAPRRSQRIAARRRGHDGQHEG